MRLKKIIDDILSENSEEYDFYELRWPDGETLKMDKKTNLPPELKYIGEIESPTKDAPKVRDWKVIRTNDKNGFNVFWSKKLKSVFKSKVYNFITWGDGSRVDINESGLPIGYKFLGVINSGARIPDANDWRDFSATRYGLRKVLSPSLRAWYEVDSGD